METNSPTDEKPSETPSEIPPTPPVSEVSEAPQDASEPPLADDSAESVSEDAPVDSNAVTAPPDELSTLAEASQRARLAPVDEERLGALLKETLLGGRGGVARAVETMPMVPWIVGVRAVEATWPELTSGFRTQLLAGLTKDDSDGARRMRLSLARALFKIDPPAATKLAVGVVKEMRDKETGDLPPKQAQIFANVFIGRAKPWLAQLSLADLKPAEAEALVHCALLAVFTVPHPPVTQLGILKWARENDRLGKLHETALDAVKKSVSRWSAKWQGALRKEVADLPEEIVGALRPVNGEAAAAESAESPEAAGGDVSEPNRDADGFREPRVADDEEDEDEDEDDENEAGEAPKKERPVYVPRPQRAVEGEEGREREPQRERPVYTSRSAGGGGSQRFNLGEALRQIDAHVQSLRSELAAAKARPKDDDRRRRPERSSGPIIEGEPTLDELARLNQQLEARNQELQARIADLTQHSEDVAVSTGAMAGQPVDDSAAQLRTLLALKLQEDFADFLALEKELNDLVVQQHYKGLLAHVFEVLRQLAIPLKSEL